MLIVTPRVREFLRTELKTSPEELIMKLEAFVLNGDNGTIKAMCTERRG